MKLFFSFEMIDGKLFEEAKKSEKYLFSNAMICIKSRSYTCSYITCRKKN